MYCLGCGADLSKPTDRRALTSPESADIATLWRMFIENEDNLRQDVDIDLIVSDGDSQRLAKMCRKCFSAYKACLKYHKSIQSNLKKAFEQLNLVATSDTNDVQLSTTLQPPSKKPRLVSQRPVFQGNQLSTSQSSGTAHSPDVAVSSNNHCNLSTPYCYFLHCHIIIVDTCWLYKAQNLPANSTTKAHWQSYCPEKPQNHSKGGPEEYEDQAIYCESSWERTGIRD